MTRFLMTLDESVSLVLMAFENGNHGDTFVQKANATNVESISKSIKKYI